jgi:hypothetical protein
MYASLKPEDDPYTIELERALQLVREKAEMIANRTIKDFGNGIQVLNGRYGPYITDGDKNAKIPKDKEPGELTEAECVELLAAAPFRPKRGGGRFGKGKAAKAAPAKKPLPRSRRRRKQRRKKRPRRKPPRKPQPRKPSKKPRRRKPPQKSGGLRKTAQPTSIRLFPDSHASAGGKALLECAAALRAGGVVAYPTEAVFGLGCDPHDRAAFDRLFALKQRPPTQGVLLIGADFEQIAPYIDLARTPADALRARARRGRAAHLDLPARRRRAGMGRRRPRRHCAARHGARAGSGVVPRIRRRDRLDQRESPRRASRAHGRRGARGVRRCAGGDPEGRNRGT